jgi:MoaA/NifB/PqqE/SkfB family radical SAM enzyme
VNATVGDGTGMMTRAQREAFLTRHQSGEIAEMLRFPMYVNIESINTCNARCIMCGIDFDKRTQVRMSEDLFQKIVAELTPWRHHIRKVNFYFDNEPLLDRDLARKIRQLKDLGIATVAIATNASGLTETRARELIGAGLDQIYISIDSLVPERYEAIRVGLKFAKVYANTLNFIRLRNEMGGKTALRIQMVLQESNQDEKLTFIPHWKNKLSPGDLAVVFRAHNWGGVVETPVFADDAGINSLPCSILWANAMIHADGKMALCSVDTEQVSPFSLGDINLETIESVWKGPKITEMRERHLGGRRAGHPLCDGCTVWRETVKEDSLIVEQTGIAVDG